MKAHSILLNSGFSRTDVPNSQYKEGNWENIWEKEKYPAEFVLLGERFLIFSSIKQKLRLQSIEDIDKWMKQQQIDFAPATEEQTSTTEKTAKPTQKKCLAANISAS